MDFLKYNKRFSFKLGGADAWDLDYQSSVTCDGKEVTSVYQFEGGIKITNITQANQNFFKGNSNLAKP